MNSVFTRKLAALTIIGAVTAGCSGEPFSQEPRVIQSTLERNRVEVRFPGSEILATASCFQGAVVFAGGDAAGARESAFLAFHPTNPHPGCNDGVIEAFELDPLLVPESLVNPSPTTTLGR